MTLVGWEFFVLRSFLAVAAVSAERLEGSFHLLNSVGRLGQQSYRWREELKRNLASVRSPGDEHRRSRPHTLNGLLRHRGRVKDLYHDGGGSVNF